MGFSESPTPLAALINLAAPSGGVCTRAELLAVLSRSTIRRRLADGSIQRPADGIYLVEPLRNALTPHHLAIKAVAASALGFGTAGEEHGFPREGGGRGRSTPVVELVTYKGAGVRRRRVDGVIIRAHETRSLPEHDIDRSDPRLPRTTPARTIVDLAGRLSIPRLQHLIQTQTSQGHPSIEDLRACVVERSRPGVPGIVKIRRLLISNFDRPPISETELEARVRLGLAEFGIEGFRTQHRPP